MVALLGADQLRKSLEDVEELIELRVTLLAHAALHSPRHAVVDVRLEDGLLNPAQRCLHRTELDEDVGAITLLVHHAQQPRHLTVDAAQTIQLGLVRGVFHLYTIPLYGI